MATKKRSGKFGWGIICLALLMACVDLGSDSDSGTSLPSDNNTNAGEGRGGGSSPPSTTTPTTPLSLIVRSTDSTQQQDSRIENFDYQNWTWGDGVLDYTDDTIDDNGKELSVTKATTTTAGASGFAVKMDSFDASAYAKLKVRYYLSTPAADLKFKIVTSSAPPKDSGDIAGLPNKTGWNEWETGLTSLGTLDPASITQMAFIYNASNVGDYLAWGDLYFDGVASSSGSGGSNIGGGNTGGATGGGNTGGGNTGGGAGGGGNNIVQIPTASTNPLIWYSDKSGQSENYNTTEFPYHGGYEGTITASEKLAGGADNTSKYIQLDGTGVHGWAAGGWSSNTPNSTFIANVSGSTKLVFWARTTPSNDVPNGNTGASSVKFGIVTYVPNAGDAGVEITQNITATWAKYEIPFTTFAAGNTQWDAQKFNVLKFVLSGNRESVDIDEISFE